MSEKRTKTDGYMLRLPDGMRDELKAAAAANERSLNAEIVARLSGQQRTLRDEFAGRIAAGCVSNPDTRAGNSDLRAFDATIARRSYEMADALLAAREAKP